MHARQETWFGDVGDDREDPTLVWTGPRTRVEPCETAPPTSSSITLIALWSLIAALALFGAALVMRVLVVAAPVPQAAARAEARAPDTRPAVAMAPAPAPAPALLQPPVEVESEAVAGTPSSPPARVAAIDEPAREVEPTRRPVARMHSRRARAKKAMHTDTPGTLRINSLPWADVYLDGTHVGHTPQSQLSMKPGRHRVKLVNEQMALRKTFDVYIRPGQVVTRSENLAL
jgi:hypothetical protein